MKINPKVKKLWKEKSERIARLQMCKYCSDSGCDEPDYHEQQLMQLAFELGLKTSHKTRKAKQ